MRLLKANEIEVKVKQVKDNGIAVLLYKTARTDMDLLDETYGPENWQCEYEEIKGNMYCKIGVWFDKLSQWVWKQDCGIESREDGEGNEKKGEASDAFKRAGFKWGIGRELYTAPFIWISADYAKIEKYKNKDAYYTKDTFSVSKIAYNDKREITALEIVNSKGKVVYTFGTKTPLKTEKITEKVTKKTTDNINDLVGDEIPFMASTAHPDEWMSVNAFAGEMERCKTLSAISEILNGQKGNPHLNDLIQLASARKAEIIETLQMEA
jgi:hypothetical protein